MPKRAQRNILLVDDDKALGELMRDYLSRFGFDLAVRTTPSAGLAALARKQFDAAVFDVMLPETDGFALCKKARAEHPLLPIMMLTARGDITDRVVGLEIGADDYLPKPFEPRELAARLQALIRRAEASQTTTAAENKTQSELHFEGLRADLRARRVWKENEGESEEIPLTAAEFRVLAVLVRASPAVVHRDILIEQIRGFERDINDRSMDITVSRLRSKLGDSPQTPRFIQTARGEGYAFIAPLIKTPLPPAGEGQG